MPDGRQIPFPGVGPRATQHRPMGANSQMPQPSPGGPQSSPAIQTGATATSGPSVAPGASTAPAGLQPLNNPRPVPPSLLDKPAQPATVKLSSGTLSVTANNSSLSDILNDLSASSGMSVDGLQKDQRVFGIYGPGDPREILSELLDGAGYNFLMVGETNAGVPREIVLTARTSAPLSPPSPSSRNEEDDEPPVPQNTPIDEVNPVLPPVAPPPGDQPQRPRSPQEMLQELQRMRQQQQMQQTQPGGPQPQQ